MTDDKEMKRIKASLDAIEEHLEAAHLMVVLAGDKAATDPLAPDRKMVQFTQVDWVNLRSHLFAAKMHLGTAEVNLKVVQPTLF